LIALQVNDIGCSVAVRQTTASVQPRPQPKPAHADTTATRSPSLLYRLMVSTPVIYARSHGLPLIYRPQRNGRLSGLVG